MILIPAVMKKIYILLFIISTFFYSNAQRWKSERLSVIGAIGTNQFMGDLGGGSKDAAHFLGIRDMDFEQTRPTIQAGFRYRLIKDISVTPSITYAYLKADDASSGSIGRQSRNLNFHSNIWELGVQFEYAFIPEKELARYTFSSLRAAKKLSAYVLVGGGGFYFNPKTELNGETIELRPLNTEGQGMGAYEYLGETITPDKPYGKFAGFISVGLGAKYQLDRRWGIGLEISNRYTTTDYLDDAHNRYYNNHTDPVAAALADRHLTINTEDPANPFIDYSTPATPYPTGSLYRGEPSYKDAYIFTLIKGYYKLKNTVKSMPKF